MNPSANQAKGYDGRPIRVGDRVQFISLYDGSLMNQGTVLALKRQRFYGTIITSDTPPDPDFRHHFSHPANHAYKV